MLASGQGVRHWNVEHRVPHMVGRSPWGGGNDQWVGYDDQESLTLKVRAQYT